MQPTKDSVNRQRVVGVLGHWSAVMLVLRYFAKWRLFTTLYNSKRIELDIATQNDNQRLQQHVKGSRLVEEDLRHRVTGLRMALQTLRTEFPSAAGQLTGQLWSIQHEPSAIGATRRRMVVDDSDHVKAVGAPRVKSVTDVATHDTSSKALRAVANKTTERVLYDASQYIVTTPTGVSPQRRVSPLRAPIEISVQDQVARMRPAGSPPKAARPSMAVLSPVKNSSRLSGYSIDVAATGWRNAISGLRISGTRVCAVSGAPLAAGIQPKDRLLRVNGTLVSNIHALFDLIDRAVGPSIGLTVQSSAGRIFTVMVPLETAEKPVATQQLPIRMETGLWRTKKYLSSPFRRPVSSPKGAYKPKY